MINIKYRDKYICYSPENSKIFFSDTFNATRFTVEKDNYNNLSDEDKTKATVTLCLMCTSKCNFACKYCYESLNNRYENITDYSTEMYYKVYNDFKNRFPSSNLIITFFGGEPLIKFDEIKKFILDISNDDKVKFMTITNASLLTDDVSKFICDYFSGVTFSLDGIKAINDSNRIFRNGNPTYSIIVENIKRFNSFNKSKHVNTACEVTFTEVYKEYNSKELFEDTYKLFEELELYQVAFIPEYSLTDEETIEIVANGIVKTFFKHLMSDEEKIVIFPQVLAICANIFLNESYGKNKCGAGQNYFSINSNGKIYPCQVMMNDSNSEIGSIGQIIKPVDFIYKYEHPLCKHCDCFHVCTSYCTVTMNNSIDKYPPSCVFLRKVTEATILQVVDIIENGGRERLIDNFKKRFCVDK